MAVTPADVKKLRDATDAGMLDCKKALVEADGDFAKAEKILKEKGLASAGKRAGRATSAGTIFTCLTDTKAAAIELNCETDFVAKTDQFIATGKAVAEVCVRKGITEVNDEIETMVKEAIAILKENMGVKKIELMDIAENEMVAEYSHNGGQIGVLIKLKCDSAATCARDEVKGLAFDLALHGAAFNPPYVSRSAVPESYVKEQEEIFTTQAQNMDKPANVVAGIVKGKLNKHLSQICFVDQNFVKDDKVTVKKAIEDVAKAVGGTVEMTGYAYFMVGQ
ncbi:MAG: translation elongation factor Ts [Spirochaetales bacterium]|nr:translation elongation factor Ts [Spirochaetales bacterium]